MASFNEHVDMRGKTFCANKAVLAIGGTTSKVKFTASNAVGVEFAIDGLYYTKANADDVFTLSGTALAASQACIFLMCLNSSGTASIVQGDIVSSEDVKNGQTTIPWPTTPVSKCAIGAVLVETDATHTFTPGTTALSAAGVTETYFDFPVPPRVGLGDGYIAATTFA
jgi:hypothetical protein